MPFLDNLTENTVLNHGLGDNQFFCTYQQLPEIFSALSRLFQIQGVTPQDCLVFACRNQLPEALLLLFLLEKGFHFLLIPQQDLGTATLPSFCRWILSREMAEVDPTVPANLVASVQLQPNPHWITASYAYLADRPKLFLRTSGSTGVPKLVMHSQAALKANAQYCVERLGLNRDDRVAIPVPLFHMYGLGAGFIPSVLVGATVDLQQGANLLRFLQCERRFNPNMAFLTPSFCETLLKGRKSPRPYRLTVVAGDRMRADSFQRYETAFGCVVQLYGSTEMGALSAAHPHLCTEIRSHTVGLPMPDVRIQLRSEVTGNASGEALWCQRACGFEAYVDLQGQVVDHEETFPKGWFHTKDRAIQHSEGYLELLGRSDHCVNRDGFLIAFSEIEMVIEKLSVINAVAVVAQGETQRGQRLIAFCVLKNYNDCNSETVRAHCFQCLPARAVPDEIRIIEQLPLLPNGKVDRQSLICLI
jgi:acyl-coenzyme A synthetase/AMP-(fatty) acid ligase